MSFPSYFYAVIFEAIFWEHFCEKNWSMAFSIRPWENLLKMQKFRNLCSSRFFASGWCCRKWSGNHTRCPSVIGDRNMMGGGFHLFIIGVEVTWAHNLAERSKIVVVLGLFLPWLAWLIPTLEINKILRVLRYDSIPAPHYNNNLIKIVMPAKYFLSFSCNFLYLVQCNIKMALKNEGDADFVLLDAKKPG